MPDSAGVRLLYTAHLGQDLSQLPRLFTLLQQERQAARGPVWVLDLGDTCSLDVWMCRVTHGRAPLMILDSMGYDAALIGGPERLTIPPASLERLRQTLVMPVITWGTVAQLTRKSITLHLATGEAELPPDGPGFRVDRTTRSLPTPGTSTLTLGDVAPGCVAQVVMAWPDWIVQSAHMMELPADMPPDPTIAAIMDFVEGEARSYAHQRGGAV